MSIRMYVGYFEREILLSRPFSELRNKLGANEISFSSDECIPDYCTAEYKAKVKHVKKAIKEIIAENPDFYDSGDPAKDYYINLLEYVEGMDDDDYLEYKAL